MLVWFDSEQNIQTDHGDLIIHILQYANEIVSKVNGKKTNPGT